jgi:hypothetical protein
MRSVCVALAPDRSMRRRAIHPQIMRPSLLRRALLLAELVLVLGVLGALGVLGTLCGCAHRSEPVVGPDRARPAVARPSGPAAPVVACAAEPPGLAPLLHPGALIVFGELHGTAESPAFVANVACLAARSGGEVAVGLEVPRDLQPQLDRFLDSAGQPDDLAALVAGEHWSSQDGNASKGLVGVIEEVRTLRHAGSKARVFFFDVAVADRGDRDQNMASRIIAEADRNAPGITIALTGNFHAKTDSERWMSWHIAKRHPELITLNIAHAGGSAYICIMGGECGIHTGVKGQDRGATPFVEMLAAPDANGYRGVYYVGGPVTPSPPVNHQGPVKVLQLPTR